MVEALRSKLPIKDDMVSKTKHDMENTFPALSRTVRFSLSARWTSARAGGFPGAGGSKTRRSVGCCGSAIFMCSDWWTGQFEVTAGWQRRIDKIDSGDRAVLKYSTFVTPLKTFYAPISGKAFHFALFLVFKPASHSDSFIPPTRSKISLSIRTIIFSHRVWRHWRGVVSNVKLRNVGSNIDTKIWLSSQVRQAKTIPSLQNGNYHHFISQNIRSVVIYSLDLRTSWNRFSKKSKLMESFLSEAQARHHCGNNPKLNVTTAEIGKKTFEQTFISLWWKDDEAYQSRRASYLANETKFWRYHTLFLTEATTSYRYDSTEMATWVAWNLSRASCIWHPGAYFFFPSFFVCQDASWTERPCCTPWEWSYIPR